MQYENVNVIWRETASLFYYNSEHIFFLKQFYEVSTPSFVCRCRLWPGLMLPSPIQMDKALVLPADNLSRVLTVRKYGSSGHYIFTQTANGAYVSTTSKGHNK